MAVTFPFRLHPRDVDFLRSGSSGPSRLTLTGRNTVNMRDAGFWRARVVFQVIDEDMVLAARGFSASVAGRGTEIIMPALPEWRPRTSQGKEIPRFNVGGPASSDGAGVVTPEPVYMTVAEPAELRATRIEINHSGMLGFRPGHYFGIGNRLYLVGRVWGDGFEYEKTVGGTMGFKGENLTFKGNQLRFSTTKTRLVGEAKQTVEFWPPLRDNVEAGEQVIVGSPVCKMTLEDDEGLALYLDRGIHGKVELNLRESV